MASLQDILSHPDFMGLPDSEKHKALTELIPGFKDLPEGEQLKGMSEIMGKVQTSMAPSEIKLDQPSYQDTTAASMGMFEPNMQMPSQEQLQQFGEKVQGFPAELGHGMIKQLPVAGMVVGGTLGGATGGPFGAPIGAGLGGAIGAGARGAIQTGMGWRTPPSLPGAIQEMGKEGVLGSLAEMGGPIIGKVAEKTVLGPWANYTEKVMAENALAKQGQQMVEQGIPISPDVISPSRTSRAVNSILENLWPANSIMASKRREIYDAAVQMKDEFAKQYGLGQTSQELMNRAFQNFSDATGNTIIPMSKTVSIINDHIDKPFTQVGKSKDFWQGPAKTFAEEGEQATGQLIRDLSNAVKQGGPKSMDKTARNKVMQAISDDLKSYDAEMGTTLYDIYAEAGNTSRMWKRIYPIENILKKSFIDSSSELGVSAFSPAKFLKEWDLQGPRLVARGNISKADKQLVDDFAEKMRTILPDITRLGKYEIRQSTPLLSESGIKGAPGTMTGVLGTSIKFPLLLLPAGAEVPLAYSLMNPTGVFRKWLTTGLKLPTMPTKMGTMKLGEELTND